MIALKQHDKTWELRTVPFPAPEVVVVSEPGIAHPMLHRRTCTAMSHRIEWPVLLDGRVPPVIREKTLALWWEVECEKAEGEREMWFCERCLMHEARVY